MFRHNLRRVFLSLACALCVVGCAARECRERLLGLQESPDHRYNAALLVRTCGGVQNVITHVNLHAGYGGPPQEGDGRATRGEVFAIDGDRKINLVWKGARSLLVECVGCGTHQVFKKESSWEDVQITYAERE